MVSSADNTVESLPQWFSSATKGLLDQPPANLSDRWAVAKQTYGPESNTFVGILIKIVNAIKHIFGCSDWQLAVKETQSALQAGITDSLKNKDPKPQEDVAKLAERFSEKLLKIHTSGPDAKEPSVRIEKWMKKNGLLASSQNSTSHSSVENELNAMPSNNDHNLWHSSNPPVVDRDQEPVLLISSHRPSLSKDKDISLAEGSSSAATSLSEILDSDEELALSDNEDLFSEWPENLYIIEQSSPKLIEDLGLPEPTVFVFKEGENELGSEQDKTYPVIKNFISIANSRAKQLRHKYRDQLPTCDSKLPVCLKGLVLLDQRGRFDSIEEIDRWLRQAKLELRKFEACDQSEIPAEYYQLKNTVEIISLEYKSALADPTNGWIGSQELRDLLKQAQLKGKTKEMGAAEYEACIDRLIIAPSNSRDHITKASNGNSNHLLRLGAISFMANPYYHLDEMVKMSKNPDLRIKKIATLEKMLKKYASDERRVATIQYAIDQIRFPASLQRSIDERRAYLEMQMLQLVQEQLNNAEQPIGDTFNMMHLLLLTETNRGWDKENNWYKNEGSFMMDMSAIFKEFEGAKIHFVDNLAAPRVDYGKNGKKILYFPAKENNSGETTLHPLFMNLAVQGRNENSEAKQKAIFGHWLQEIKKIAPPNDPELNEIEKRFNEGESDFYLVDDVFCYVRKLGISLSTGCMSAKDRTGVACEVNAITFILEEYARDFRIKHNLPQTQEEWEQRTNRLEVLRNKPKKTKKEQNEYLKLCKFERKLQLLEKKLEKKLEKLSEAFGAGMLEEGRPGLEIANQCCAKSKLKKQITLKTVTAGVPHIGKRRLLRHFFRLARNR